MDKDENSALIGWSSSSSYTSDKALHPDYRFDMKMIECLSEAGVDVDAIDTGEKTSWHQLLS